MPDTAGPRAPDDTDAGLRLGFQPPYDWPWVLRFLETRRIAGVEAVERGRYARVMRVGDGARARIGWVEVASDEGGGALCVRVSASLRPARDEVARAIGQLFDLSLEPAPVNAVLGELSADVPGVRLPGAVDGFELVCRAILGQQVSVKAAHTLAGRIAQRLGDPLPGADAPDGAPSGLTHAFPTPQRLAGVAPQALLECGLIRARAEAIQAVARALAETDLRLVPTADPTPVLAALLAIRGIGEWTAQYVAMRALGWRDAFPASDLIVMRELEATTPARSRALAQAWRPWRAYAVMHLWRRAAGRAPQAASRTGSRSGAKASR